jgi:hypothetical protein
MKLFICPKSLTSARIDIRLGFSVQRFRVQQCRWPHSGGRFGRKRIFRKTETMNKLKLFAGMILLGVAAPLISAPAGAAEDTLYVSGKAVVFFGPSQSEYLAMSHEQKDAIDEELYDFFHSRGEVSAFLAENSIQQISTGRLKIQVQLDKNRSIDYSRKDFDRVVGLILTDGRREPLVLLGAVTVPDLLAEFEDYFGINPP